MSIRVIPSHSLKAFRYRVHCLGQFLWKEKDPVCRANLSMELADAASTLAQLEAQAAHQPTIEVGIPGHELSDLDDLRSPFSA